MAFNLERIKELFQFQVIESLQGESVITKGKCSPWTRKKELKNDKDIFYVRLSLKYKGLQEKSVVYIHFHLEDSEGYFSDAMPPDDYLEKQIKHGEQIEGGLLFSIYRDTVPSRLWFDTQIPYENSKESVLMDIALPLPQAETRTQFFAKEELANKYGQKVANNALSPSHNTEKFIEEISHHCKIPYRKIIYGYILRVPLAEGRKQNVILNFRGKEKESDDLINIGTICGPVDKKTDPYAMLKMNSTMNYGAIGISNIQGKDFYVITASYLISTITKELASAAIQSIANYGDQIEKKITGEDIQ